ncbi:MAG: hypothetical protein V3T49_00505, partial [Dehalococcoidia bacterium]
MKSLEPRDLGLGRARVVGCNGENFHRDPSTPLRCDREIGGGRVPVTTYSNNPTFRQFLSRNAC